MIYINSIYILIRECQFIQKHIYRIYKLHIRIMVNRYNSYKTYIKFIYVRKVVISIKNELSKPIFLSFSKKNYDVAEILNKISKDGIPKTDYICEAVRFYFNNKNLNSSFSKIELEDMVKKMVYKYLNEYLKSNSTFNTEDKINLPQDSNITAADLEDD